MKQMTKLETIVMNMTGVDRTNANLVVNAIISELQKDGDMVDKDEAIKEFYLEKLEPAAECGGHEEDCLDMFMEVVWDLRRKYDTYPQWFLDYNKKHNIK